MKRDTGAGLSIHYAVVVNLWDCLDLPLPLFCCLIDFRSLIVARASCPWIRVGRSDMGEMPMPLIPP